MPNKQKQHDKPPEASKKKRIFLILSWVIVVLWACVIFYMSSKSSTGLDQDLGIFSQVHQQLKLWQEGVFGPGVDIISPVAHFLEYLVFGVLLTNLLRQYMPLRRACVLAILIASAYGVTDEFHQYFVPGRMTDPIDWFVDTIGASLGAGLAYISYSRTASDNSGHIRRPQS